MVDFSSTSAGVSRVLEIWISFAGALNRNARTSRREKVRRSFAEGNHETEGFPKPEGFWRGVEG